MKGVLGGACLALACAGAALAAEDELWEITTQMNMAGMPAGMGTRTQQVCSEKGDPKKAAMQGNDKCKLTDFKESGNRITMTLSCPEGTGVIENTYNAARSEYKGTMRLTTKQGEMTMNMSGRKLGSCDAQQAKSERDAKTAAVKGQMDQIQAQMAASEDRMISECAAGAENMQAQRLAACVSQPGNCSAMGMKRAETACAAHAKTYCDRYQTIEGFMQTEGDATGATLCKVSRDQVRASLCQRALEPQNLLFLGRYCPVEAKPVAQQHCAGRSMTFQPGDKIGEFCMHYLAQANLESSGSRSTPAPAASQPAIDPKQAITEGVTQGINKLKGLFGR